MTYYVVYRGDEVLAVGTAPDLAKLFGKTVEYVKSLARPSNVKRADGCRNRIMAEKVNL